MHCGCGPAVGLRETAQGFGKLRQRGAVLENAPPTVPPGGYPAPSASERQNARVRAALADASRGRFPPPAGLGSGGRAHPSVRTKTGVPVRSVTSSDHVGVDGFELPLHPLEPILADGQRPGRVPLPPPAVRVPDEVDDRRR